MKKDSTKVSFARLAILSVLHALFVCVADYALLYVLLFMAEFFGGSSGIVFAYIVGIGVPAVLGYLFVDRIKWWLISLPVQLIVDIVGMGVIGTYSGIFAGETVETALILLALQAAGVIARALWLKWKVRKGLQK